MAASHSVAGEDIEHGDDEEADAGSNENRVEHVQLPLSEGHVASIRYVQPQ
jgi:hypothetical protein